MKVILDTNLKSTTDQRDEEGVRTVFLVPTQNLGGEETSKLAGSRLLSHAPRLLALPARSLLAGPFHADPEREKGGKREQNKKDAEGWACGGQRRSLTETGPRARAGWGLNFRPAWGTENREESSVRLHKS